VYAVDAYGEFCTVLGGALWLSQSTLSGALDIVAVEHEDGHIECTPFHVRFGRSAVYHAEGQAVTMSVNGNPVHLTIKVSWHALAVRVRSWLPIVGLL
jgi:phosphatidate phosphatase LPIN